jgi:hypothetical protein
MTLRKRKIMENEKGSITCHGVRKRVLDVL